ncbi:TIGR04222 domain-containing membrane protein [Gandjariella thermophila]|uniref:TIGR04222 domain-containing membrane protein n=1 Tax=Gandjariella thermophila TaxID=1931992 RepID=A0A4D4JHC7_9PSEU|nr:TIGR04222 domain-containing membrane protein [Gandjariella thermophila]GDY33297.1 hypothetical protein GTS_49300 [Gandjariella thermophila]
MGPWSLAGIEVTIGYVVALAAAALWARLVMRRPAPRHRDHSAAPLSVTELAYLADGPRRVVHAAVTRLLGTGALRIDRDGTLRATGDGEPGTAGQPDPVEGAVLAAVGAGAPIGTLAGRVAGDPAVRAISIRLAELDLLSAAQASRARQRVALLPLIGLALLGALRCAQLAWTGQPMLGVTVLLALTGAVLAAIPPAAAGRRTALGEEVLRQARRRSAERGTPHPEESVALHGLLGHPDPRLRALLCGAPERAEETSGAHHPGR